MLQRACLHFTRRHTEFCSACRRIIEFYFLIFLDNLLVYVEVKKILFTMDIIDKLYQHYEVLNEAKDDIAKVP